MKWLSLKTTVSQMLRVFLEIAFQSVSFPIVQQRKRKYLELKPQVELSLYPQVTVQWNWGRKWTAGP